MGLVDEVDCGTANPKLVDDLDRLDHRRVEAGTGKRIGKARLQPVENVGPRVERDWAAALGDRAQLVDAVAMVGVIVGDDHRVDVANAGVEQLASKIGPAIDQQAFPAAIDQQSAAASPVARFVGIAIAPLRSDPRNARGRAAAEDS